MKKILLCFLLAGCSPPIAKKTISSVPVENIDWNEFNNNSIVTKDEIELKHIQGKWITFKSICKVEDKISNATVGEIIEIKESTFIEDGGLNIVPFKLTGNIITRVKYSVPDTFYINKVTSSELVLTMKMPLKKTYCRFYFKK